MFIIKCKNCGREQEWKAGIDVSTAAIQCAEMSVFCDCGAVVSEVDGFLQESKEDINTLKYPSERSYSGFFIAANRFIPCE